MRPQNPGRIKVKILQICHRVPYPLLDGGNIAMLNMALSLQLAGAEVHQFALNTRKHYVDPASLPDFIKSGLNFRSTDIDTRIQPGAAFLNLFLPGSYNVSRFYDQKVEQEIINILKETNFDFIQLETLFASPYLKAIRKYSQAKVVLRAHNAEYLIWKRMAAAENNSIKKKYLSFLSRRLKKYEQQVLTEIDALVPITPIDLTHFKDLGYHGPVQVIPLGIDMQDYPEQPAPEAIKLFHLGSMDWLPNQEAIRWFLNACWPSVHALHPDLELFLAGRGFPEDLLSKRIAGVHMQGRVEDAAAFMRDKQVMLVPLHSGSGMRVKIIQGMAMGKTILSTSIGAEGIEVSPGKNILIADSPAEFLEKINACLRSPEWCINIGKEGRKLVQEKYSNESLGNQLLRFYSSL